MYTSMDYEFWNMEYSGNWNEGEREGFQQMEKFDNDNGTLTEVKKKGKINDE